MEKEKIIQLIEHELVQADEANSEVDFEKHIYAIRTLTELVTSDSENVSYKEKRQTSSKAYLSQSRVEKSSSQGVKQQGTDEISMSELKAMGGNVPASQQTTANDTSISTKRMVTDDELGNGESIFDF